MLEVIALTRSEAFKNSVSVRTQFAEGLPPFRQIGFNFSK